MSIIKGQVQDGDMIDVHNRRRQQKKNDLAGGNAHEMSGIVLM